VAYLLLNTKFETIGDIDDYDSMIWTDRYYKCGDFELSLAASSAAVAKYKEDFYIWTDDTKELMVVEDASVVTDSVTGSMLKVTGRSLASLLDRRLIWDRTVLSGNLQAGVKTLIEYNAGIRASSDRVLPGVVFKASTDPAVTGLTIDAKYERGAKLYDSIVEICVAYDLGFKITMPSDGVFQFELYAGDDRSYGQLANPQVIFSPDFDNLKSSNFFRSKRDLKNVALIGGEGSDAAKVYLSTSVSNGGGSGLQRRETYLELSSITSKDGDNTIPADQYYKMLIQKGKEELFAQSVTLKFDGEVEMLPTFEYNKDFFMGDIVQLENEFGIASTTRVVEFIRSSTPAGTAAYPTMESIEL
jgi:hypothetical protein